MIRFLPYVLKTLWRNRARSILTMSGTAAAMFVFCFVVSIQQGMQRLTTGEEATRRLVVFQENRFCPSSSRLPQDYARLIAKVNGVSSVTPMQVWTSNCRASLDIVVFNGMPIDQMERSKQLHLASGSWDTLKRQSDGAMVGAKIAKRRGLKEGGMFSIGDMTVKIAGIFESSNASEENLIYTDLGFLQRSQGTDATGLVTQFEVELDKNADADEVSRLIDQELKSGPVPTTTRLKGAFQAATVSDLVDLVGFINWLGYACVALVLSIVSATMLMSSQDRQKEHGVLQMIGLRPSRVFSLVLAESIIVTLVGGLVGTMLASLILGWRGIAVGAEGVSIGLTTSLAQVLVSISTALIIGILSGVLPAWNAANSSLVNAMK